MSQEYRAGLQRVCTLMKKKRVNALSPWEGCIGATTLLSAALPCPASQLNITAFTFSEQLLQTFT